MADRVLVTGADGSIGRMMIPALVEAGFAVTAFDQRFRTESAADRTVTGDGRDEETVRDALRDASIVLHLAGIPNPNHPSQAELFANNTAVTFTVLHAAGEAGVHRAAIASSVRVLGYLPDSLDAMPPYYPIDELTPLAIQSAYPLAKFVDESTLRALSGRFGFSAVALRLPLVAGVDALERAAADAAGHPERSMQLGSGYLMPDDVGRLATAAVSAPFEGFHAVHVSGPRTFAPLPTRELIARYAPDAAIRADLPGYAVPVDTAAARELLGFGATGFIEFDTQR
jgi:nucleoside-diphosphate-sugar epimerase